VFKPSNRDVHLLHSHLPDCVPVAILPLAIAPAGKLIHDNSPRPANMTSSDPEPRGSIPFIVPVQAGKPYLKATVSECGTCIIQDFFAFLGQSHPTAVFSLSMSLLAFFRLAISPLVFSMCFALGSAATLCAAVSLSPPTTPADTKHRTTPAALDLE